MYTKLVLLFILMALTVSLFLVAGCDKLTTQINNNTYYDSTLAEACLTCHSDVNSPITVPKGQWQNSAHASANLIEQLVVWDSVSYMTNQCGPRCHTGQGFVQYVTNKSEPAQTKPSVMDCFTCHMPHTGPYGTWSLQTLRGDSNAVTLRNGSDYNVKRSNQCVICHQAAAYADISGGTSGQVTLDSLGPNGPHSGSDAEMMLGVSGYLFGTVQDSGSHKMVNTASLKGCLACHYGQGQGYEFGEHTFHLRDTITNVMYTDNCNVSGCHSSSKITDFFASPALDSIKSLTDSLAGRLVAIHILQNTPDLTHFYKDSTVPTDAGRILYNYLLVKQDGSRGVHNARYSLNLLKASLGRLDSIPSVSFSVPESTCVGTQIVPDTAFAGAVTTKLWDWGDGTTPSSTPTHQYSNPGAYIIKLTASGSAGTAKAEASILVGSATLVPLLSAIPTSGVAPLSVNFVDTTAGTGFTRTWDWGDGTPVSSAKDTTHTYDTPGTYWAKLTLTNPCKQFVDSVQITVTATVIGMRRPDTSPR